MIKLKNDIKQFCSIHKKGIFRVANVIAPACAITVLIFTVSFFNGRSYALVLDNNGQSLGAVSDEQVLNSVVTDINQNLSDEAIDNNNNIQIVPQYTLAPINENSQSGTDDIKNKIIATSGDEIDQGCGLYVNGSLAGFVSNDDKSSLTDGVYDKLNCVDTTSPDTSASFYDNVEIKDGIYPVSSFKTTSQMNDIVNSNKIESIQYVSKEGDTLETIAQSQGVSIDSIKDNNPDIESCFIPDDNTDENIESSKLTPDTSINIEKEVPFLPVKVTTKQSYTASIPFDNTDVPNNDEYTDYSQIVQEGVNGSADCVDYVTTVNGIETERKSISKDITAQPVSQVTSVGTKAYPSNKPYIDGATDSSDNSPGVATGIFMWPVPDCHTISSPFGARWGSFHSGIDIAGGLGGQTIVAADGGTVVKASNSNDGYGNCVIIEHNGEYSTLYGHCATLLVSVGDQVSKGQPIATVGSTGDSTGPHLHFEIRQNGTAVDPEPYIENN